MEGKVGRCPVAWKNWAAARDHETTEAHGTLKSSGRVKVGRLDASVVITQQGIRCEGNNGVCLTGVLVQAGEVGATGVDVQHGSGLQQEKQEGKSHSLRMEQQKHQPQESTKQDQWGRVHCTQPVSLHSWPAVCFTTFRGPVLQRVSDALIQLWYEVVQFSLRTDSRAGSVLGGWQRRSSRVQWSP